jgi:hypothetical protein
MPAGQARTTIVGVFVGCALGQGLTECRVTGRDGRDYFLSANTGGGLTAGNTARDVFAGIDGDAWKGRTVAIEAGLAPDGSIARVFAIGLARQPDPQTERKMRTDVVLSGVIDQTDDGFSLQTRDARYTLAPGRGLRFGDLADLMFQSDGRPVTLRGDIMDDKGGPVLIVTATHP